MKNLRKIVFSSSTNSASEISKNSRFNIEPILLGGVVIDVLNGGGTDSMVIANGISNRIKNASLYNDFVDGLILVNESNIPIITEEAQYILIKL